jgi:hypothetical protein
MHRTASKERELPKRGKKPTTYRRIVTGNVNGKSVIQSDEPLLAYQFKTIPGYEHTLMWINPAIPDLSDEQRFNRYPDSVVPGADGTSLREIRKGVKSAPRARLSAPSLSSLKRAIESRPPNDPN